MEYLFHMSSQYAELRPISSLVPEFGTPQQISTGFASWLHYCTNVAQRNIASCKIHFAPKSSILLYCQRYCMALEQWASAKVCSIVQGMELRNFHRGLKLHSLGGANVNNVA